MLLTSFGNQLNVAIVGASGGIGSALVARLQTESSVSRILAFSRAPRQEAGTSVDSQPLDLTDTESVEAAIQHAASIAPLDLVVVASGLLHSAAIDPEKSMRSTDYEVMRSVFDVNTFGPALVAAGLLPLMRKGTKSVFAALSARVGSIGDNRLGGWVSYRASKAALNMVLRTFAVEQARRNPNCVVASLHPGTVDTALSKPFTSRTGGKQLVQPDDAALNLLAVINMLSPEDTGGFFAWDGSRIEY